MVVEGRNRLMIALDDLRFLIFFFLFVFFFFFVFF